MSDPKDLEHWEAMARLGMVPSRKNDYGHSFSGSFSLQQTQNDYTARVRSGMSIRGPEAGAGKKGIRRLLDNGELNLGALAEVPPNQVENYAGIRQRILDLRSDSNLSQFCTVSFTVLPTIDNFVTTDNDDPNRAGPLVGIVEFGNGSAFSTVEIDLQRTAAPYNAGTLEPSDPTQFVFSPNGSNYLSVPGSSVRVFARNDGNLKPLSISRVLNAQASAQVPVPTAKVMAHVSYGIRSSFIGATRTIWLLKKSTAVWPIGSVIRSAIPPFARTLQIHRSISGAPGTAPEIYYQFFVNNNGVNLEYEDGTIAAGAQSPTITVPNGASAIWIENKGPSTGPDANLALVYGIGI